MLERRREVHDLKFVHPEMTKAAQECHREISRSDRTVWLDVRKSKEEMLPRRMVKRAGELISKLLAESRQAVVVCTMGKVVLMGGTRAGATRYVK